MGIWVWMKAFLFATTIHKDVTTRLKRQNPELYRQVKQVLSQNKAERHLRGGAATKEKYSKLQTEKE